MITFESQLADEHRARGFFRELPDPQAASAVIAEQYWDDDDQARQPALRRILQRRNVSAIAYPTLGHRDVLQVFLRDSGGEPVFITSSLLDICEASTPTCRSDFVAIEAVLEQALRLSAEERTELVERLLDSLDEAAPADPDREAAWTEVLDRRLQEIREGRVETIAAAEAIAQARAAARRR